MCFPGYKVLETLRFKVIDLSMYESAPNELLLGQVAILGGKNCKFETYMIEFYQITFFCLYIFK